MSNPDSSTDSQHPPARFAEVDVLKAICILAVVLIHSTRSFWDPSQSGYEVWLKQVLRFAVPGFLAVSGFLYATCRPVPVSQSLGRLRRILVPYLIAAACAEAYWAFRGLPRDLETIGTNFAVANSFGQYYYIFVLVPLVVISPLLARISLRVLWLIFLTGLTLQGLFETHFIGNFHPVWRIRNPIMWWPYFLLGWLIRLHYRDTRAWVINHRWLTAAVLWVAAFACWQVPRMPEIAEFRFLATWLGIYLSIGGIFILSCAREVHWVVRWLSEATYAIYLLHLFFVIPGVEFFRADFGAFEPLTIGKIWLIGLVGPVVIILALRAALGDRSRDIVGA